MHLGSMAYAMADIVGSRSWHPGDMLVVNDPYLGGTHLPDVTVIAPVYAEGQLMGFAANRAHHANIGASEPGSMPVSRSLEEEGEIIAPRLLVERGEVVESVLGQLCGVDTAAAHSIQARGDFAAQISACRLGVERLGGRIESMGCEAFASALAALNDYGERLARHALAAIPQGRYRFEDFMDDDGAGQQDIAIAVTLRVGEDGVVADFTGTSPQVPGNINCPLSVAAAAVFYVFRCLMPAQTPACAGSFRPIRIVAPEGCLVNAKRPAAVAAGNVETSTRMVDVILGALAQALPEQIPAASTGSMNNVAMGAPASAQQPALGLLRDQWRRYGGRSAGRGLKRCADSYDQHPEHTHRKSRAALPCANYPLPVAPRIRRSRPGEGRRRFDPRVPVSGAGAPEPADGKAALCALGAAGWRAGCAG